MTFSVEQIKKILHDHYGLEAEVKPLPGEIDFNYHVESADRKRYVLKVANAAEIRQNLELQNALMDHLTTGKFDLSISSVVGSRTNGQICEIKDSEGNTRMMRLLTWVEGRVLAHVNPHNASLLQSLGEMCGKLCRALKDFDHPAAHRFMKWDPAQVAWTREYVRILKPQQQKIVDDFYSVYQTKALPLLPNLRKSVNYNDANDYNVLVNNNLESPAVPGVIDFGDAVYTHTVNELAVAVTYAMMGKPDPLEAACHIVRGFNKQFKLENEELMVLYSLIAARLIISVTCSAINLQDHPENGYLQISDKPAWDLLEKLRSISPDFAYYAFRYACDLTPCPAQPGFEHWVENKKETVSYPVDIPEKFSWVDLSAGSLDLGNHENLLDADKLNDRFTAMMREIKADLAIGRYDEARAIYSTTAYATQGNDSLVWRTVHLGLDFFAPPQQPVRAVLDGIIHSFGDNNAERDYGPTIIIEHQINEDLSFYTLYGHLTRSSLMNLTIGKKIKRNDVIGYVGAREENGNWPPHLHFQVILNMLGAHGDFPGVAYAHQREIWKSICPDPWLLLTGKHSPAPELLSKTEIVDYRKQHLGKNLSLSYREPIKMVRGYMQYLYDETGRRYLDTVNNVPHVGHENSRVVKAGQRQMAVLNTNTRYLHHNIVKFTEALLSTMPKELNVAFIVNSGSEANELALRLAKNFTGQKDMIVSEVGYHGNTNACVEISSYKFDGPGGKGAAPHVHVTPIPDTYR
ncbi:MAG: aminotransferase class III-fold pyridoxal phosphate-dependent enzyme, partial [Bacteroidota bacterium]